ncbi:MAG: sensor histidine kinase, partial [Methanobacteriota archaeon]
VFAFSSALGQGRSTGSWGNLAFLAIPLVLSSMLAGTRTTVATGVVAVLAVAAIPLVDATVAWAVVAPPLVLLLMVAALQAMFAGIRGSDLSHLAASEGRLRDIVEHATNLFYAHTPDHVLTYVSPQTRRFFDCGPEEALVRWTEFATDHPMNRAGLEATERAIATGQPQPPYELELAGRAGRTIWVEVNETPIVREGRTVAIVGSLTDVTERKKAEEQVRASEERFRSLAESANDAIVSADAAGRITFFNAGAERMFGRPGADVVGSPLTVLMPARFHAAHTAGLSRFLSTGEAHVIGKTVELSGVRNDGTEFPFELSLATWTLGGGRFFTAILRDITDRKKAEAEIRSLASSLERRVAERTRELAEANRELEAFAYAVSHDLRAPLRAVDGFGQALLEDAAGSLDERARRHLDRIRAAIQRMGLLIDELLELSRVGRAAMRRGPVDLSGLATEIGAELAAGAPRRAVRLAVAPGIRVDADRALLMILLRNLLENAWKFTSKNPTATIEVGAKSIGGERVFFVRDDGAGFDPEFADRLFVPFSRLHSAEEFPGTGVGLSTVLRIVRRHGGRAWADGAVGKGATFHFTLPEATP